MSEEPEYLTMSEARRYIQVSEYKLNRLLFGDERRGVKPVLPYIDNPYHQGSRLIKRSDLDAWLAQVPRRPKKHKKPEESLSHVAAA